jgi:glycine cleavage system aminomethyltransferase T
MMSTSTYPRSNDTVRVGSRRFEQSPYYESYANADTILGIYAGRYYPTSLGEDPVATYWKLRREVVLYDVPEKPWQIDGPDALPFLERVFARHIADLPEGRARYAIACTPRGGVFMDGILFKLAEDRFWYVQPDGPLEAWLVALSAGMDVHISDPKSRVLQIQGPRSMTVMAELTHGSIDESMRYFHSGYYDIRGQRLYVSRTGWTGELGYEIYSDATTDHGRLWDDVTSVGKPHGMVAASTASMGIRRIEAGILDNLTDFDPSMTPFQAGLGAFIDLGKEGFLGREALLDADPRSLLLGVTTPAGTPVVGETVYRGSTPIGRITAATWSPTLDCGIGYIRFHAADDWIGSSVTLTTADGGMTLADVVSLPFFDPHKRIPRGLHLDTP